MLNNTEIKKIEELCKENRQNIVKMVNNAQSGHIGGALSSTEIMTVLFHKCMLTAPKWKDDKNYEQRDRFVLSKGHASAIYYSVLSQLGYFPKKDLMTFRLFGSLLQGHPAPFCPGVEVATGSLGQGLSIACGIAMALKLNKNPAHVFVLLGDGELQEGSVWEGFMNAPIRKLDNLIAIIDRNRLQIDGCTENIKALDPLDDKLRAFNWQVIEIDGHNINAVYEAIETAKSSDKPVAIIANTIKGKGVSFMENNAGWHGKATNKDEFERAMKELE
ncbi:TPA: transketolase [Candidatus Scatousia excrementigallinarum]|uniref:Transketolase n=1 Tax=Candidatus Scatousia excrementigallinarum TaxID=2840935 RepID=A0A9D1EWX3_9BACT|nr:transketolase [Candidatus Scatousia excrementigallinarum]